MKRACLIAIWSLASMLILGYSSNAHATCTRLWTSVAAGYDHTCGTTNDGRLYCWGRNDKGQAGGIPDWTNVLTPYVIFTEGGQIVKVSTNGNHTCAISHSNGANNASLWCFGDNSNWETGGTGNISWSPYGVSTGVVHPVKDVAVGMGNTCFIDGNDDLRCWGKKDLCQLGGSASTTPTSTPTLAPTMNQNDTWPQAVKQVSLQNGTICGVGIDGSARCWGNKEYGLMGNGSAGGYTCTPVSPSIPFNNSVRDVQVGAGFTCWSDQNDSYRPYCSGFNYHAQLARGYQTTTSPYYVTTPAVIDDYWLDDGIPLLQLGTGYGLNGVGLSEGAVYTWGYGIYGANGDGTTTVRTKPTMVVVNGYPINVSQISAGSNYNCGVKPDGTALYCWGVNDHGQLGDGTTTNRTTPVSIPCPN